MDHIVQIMAERIAMAWVVGFPIYFTHLSRIEKQDSGVDVFKGDEIGATLSFFAIYIMLSAALIYTVCMGGKYSWCSFISQVVEHWANSQSNTL